MRHDDVYMKNDAVYVCNDDANTCKLRHAKVRQRLNVYFKTVLDDKDTALSINNFVCAYIYDNLCEKIDEHYTLKLPIKNDVKLPRCRD